MVIDDSLNEESKKSNRQLCEDIGIIYHGHSEQSDVMSQLETGDISTFVDSLGTVSGSIGKIRNYALILGAALNSSKLIMMDDDIHTNDCFGLDDLMSALNVFDYAGAYIENMPDRSVIGHLLDAVGLIQHQYVSGGFLGIHQPTVDNYFLSEYNEDWIWLYMELNGCKAPKLGSVRQMKYDPFDNAASNAVSQEFGEVLLKGIFKTKGVDMEEQLTNADFWEAVQKERSDQIKKYLGISYPNHLSPTNSIVFDAVLNKLDKTSPSEYAVTFQTYFNRLGEWQKILDTTRGTSIDLPIGGNYDRK